MKEETILVLYGSQRGTGEGIARKFATLVPEKLNVEHQLTVIPQIMEMDEFLEMEATPWTRLVVIFVSSFGMGNAPIGAKTFRKICDTWLDKAKVDETAMSSVLDGVHFAICGFGDTKYATYQMNPTKICDALQVVGARLIAKRGECDASKGRTELEKAAEEWMDMIWKELSEVLAKDSLAPDRYMEMKAVTISGPQLS